MLDLRCGWLRSFASRCKGAKGPEAYSKGAQWKVCCNPKSLLPEVIKIERRSILKTFDERAIEASRPLSTKSIGHLYPSRPHQRASCIVHKPSYMAAFVSISLLKTYDKILLPLLLAALDCLHTDAQLIYTERRLLQDQCRSRASLGKDIST